MLSLGRSLRVLQLSILSVVLCSGCTKRSPHIRVVVPTGFRGAVLIYVEQPNGLIVKPQDNRYVLTIPPEGILRLKERAALRDWHTLSACFLNDEEIPVAWEEEQIPEGVVAFWGGGSRPGGLTYDFIVTKARRFGRRRPLPMSSQVELSQRALRRPAKERSERCTVKSCRVTEQTSRRRRA